LQQFRNLSPFKINGGFGAKLLAAKAVNACFTIKARELVLDPDRFWRARHHTVPTAYTDIFVRLGAALEYLCHKPGA